MRSSFITLALLPWLWPLIPALQTGPSPAVPWSEIHLVARKFLMTARTSVRVERVPAAQAAVRLAATPGARAIEPGAPFVDVLHVSSSLPFGRRERATVWNDPASGAALQSEKLVTRKRAYWKRRRFVADGYQEWRAEPAGKREAAGAPEGWTRREHKAVPCTGALPPGAVLTDSYSMLYSIAAARLDRAGAAATIFLCSRGMPVEIRFVAGRRDTARIDVAESWPGGHRRRRGKIAVRHVIGVPRWLGPGRGGDPADTGFMGMRGPIDVVLEEGTGTPISITGRAKGVGRLTVRLERIVLRERPASRVSPGGP